jgi:hypothetical protein
MSPTNTIDRLRAANPARLEPERAHSDAASVALQQILSEPPAAGRHGRKRLRARLPRGGVAVALALGLAGGGAAFAATNPFGWWSPNPDQAKYALNLNAHARAPKAYGIGCRAEGGAGFVCWPASVDSLGRPHARGQLYTRLDTIHQPSPPSLFTRAHFLKAIEKLRPAVAAKLRHDLARVPDSFFTEMRLGSRYGSYGIGVGPGQRVPPRGTPTLLVCEQVGDRISCQDLNGDEHAPIGAGVYGAQPAPDWVPAPPQRSDYGLPPGIRFTRAEYHLLFDMLRFATTAHSSGKPQAVKQASNP